MAFNSNNSKVSPSEGRCIHELFEDQVERTPDSVAVVFEGEQLTYRELNRRANQVAHYLKNLGVGPEVLVGICVERALDGQSAGAPGSDSLFRQRLGQD